MWCGGYSVTVYVCTYTHVHLCVCSFAIVLMWLSITMRTQSFKGASSHCHRQVLQPSHYLLLSMFPYNGCRTTNISTKSLLTFEHVSL